MSTFEGCVGDPPGPGAFLFFFLQMISRVSSIEASLRDGSSSKSLGIIAILWLSTSPYKCWSPFGSRLTQYCDLNYTENFHLLDIGVGQTVECLNCRDLGLSFRRGIYGPPEIVVFIFESLQVLLSLPVVEVIEPLANSDVEFGESSLVFKDLDFVVGLFWFAFSPITPLTWFAPTWLVWFLVFMNSSMSCLWWRFGRVFGSTFPDLPNTQSRCDYLL